MSLFRRNYDWLKKLTPSFLAYCNSLLYRVVMERKRPLSFLLQRKKTIKLCAVFPIVSLLILRNGFSLFEFTQ